MKKFLHANASSQRTQDNGLVIKHWIDRVEWIQNEGDNKNTTFTLVNVLKKEKSDG